MMMVMMTRRLTNNHPQSLLSSPHLLCKNHWSMPKKSPKTPPDATITNFAKKSKANSAVEKRRRLIAEEEQDLLLDGPGCTFEMPSISQLGHDSNKDVELAVNHVLETGLCHFPALLNTNECILLKNHINHILQVSKNNVECQNLSFLSHFGPIMARTNRYDVLLPLDHKILPPVRKVLSSGVEEIMRAIVGEWCFLLFLCC
jgi:hypothetical protein